MVPPMNWHRPSRPLTGFIHLYTAPRLGAASRTSPARRSTSALLSTGQDRPIFTSADKPTTAMPTAVGDPDDASRHGQPTKPPSTALLDATPRSTVQPAGMHRRRYFYITGHWGQINERSHGGRSSVPSCRRTTRSASTRRPLRPRTGRRSTTRSGRRHPVLCTSTGSSPVRSCEGRLKAGARPGSRLPTVTAVRPDLRRAAGTGRSPRRHYPPAQRAFAAAKVKGGRATGALEPGVSARQPPTSRRTTPSSSTPGPDGTWPETLEY